MFVGYKYQGKCFCRDCFAMNNKALLAIDTVFLNYSLYGAIRQAVPFVSSFRGRRKQFGQFCF